MAENVTRLLNTMFPGQKAMLWAHNGHITKRAYLGRRDPPMGEYLERTYGGTYQALGLSFAAGTIRAADRKRGLDAGMIPIETRSVTSGSLDALLSGPTVARYLDLHEAAGQQELKDWFAGRVGIANVGFWYTPGTPILEAYHLPDAFDGLISVKRSTAAQPLK